MKERDIVNPVIPQEVDDSFRHNNISTRSNFYIKS